MHFVSNMDSGMFYGTKKGVNSKSWKAWFDAMNEIYKKDFLRNGTAWKLGQKYKEGVGYLFGQSCWWNTSAADFIDDLAWKSILLRRELFWEYGEGYIRFAFMYKEEKKIEAISRF
jgi:aspartate/methionine/tyrosine aminotransferase